MAVVSTPVPVQAEYPSFKKKSTRSSNYTAWVVTSPGGMGYEHSGLDMRNYDTLMKGTKYGSVIVPDDAFTSNLMVLIDGRVDKSLKMPLYSSSPTRKDRWIISAWIIDGAGDNDVFRNVVNSIFEKNCLACHQPGGKGYSKSGLNMRTYSILMKGTKFGPVIVPHDSFTSNLVVLMEGRANPKLKMPPPKRRNLSRWERR
ncbi:MAG: c-type cytochrome domain-containing protein, partial [Rhodospirillales bacterium]|nr:c-type cytochrome domain-containing protein [Rhodospirillales bacterium]